ncbi:unnamed protein product [Dovyalis caffra]|uniref:Uncharacterized protein n=1 Tax=Dovyalis caffra TaxID=77055 RepID=A0AAV1QNB9_9ROSI|nr:unnamed protein product [Dovyalis caffra]
MLEGLCKSRATFMVENEETLSTKPIAQASTEKLDTKNDITTSSVNSTTSPSNGKLLNKKDLDVPVEHPSSLPAKEIEVVIEDHLIDDGQNIKSREVDIPIKTDKEKSPSITISSPTNKETILKSVNLKATKGRSLRSIKRSKANMKSILRNDRNKDEASSMRGLGLCKIESERRTYNT